MDGKRDVKKFEGKMEGGWKVSRSSFIITPPSVSTINIRQPVPVISSGLQARILSAVGLKEHHKRTPENASDSDT